MKTVLFPLLLFFTLGCEQEKQNERIKFNQQEWIQGDRTLRGKMVDNLIEDSILYGKSKFEVLGLLGSPTASDTTNPLVYQVDIGKRTGPFGIGGAWLFFLTVEFDTSTNVVKNFRCGD